MASEKQETPNDKGPPPSTSTKDSSNKKKTRGLWQLGCSAIFFGLVIFQLPFFEMKQRKEEILVGEQASPSANKHLLVRVSPIQVVVSQLMLSQTIPDDYLRAVLWPGAAVKQAKRTIECEIGLRTKGCKKKAKYLPSWKNLIQTNDPRKVDEMMSSEFKERKVQLVAGSFFCVFGLIFIPFSLTRLPFFGCAMFMYPLLRKGLWPSWYLAGACVCSLVVIHLEGLGKKAQQAAAKPTSTSKKQVQLDEAKAKLEHLKSLEANMKAEQAARKLAAKQKLKGT